MRTDINKEENPNVSKVIGKVNTRNNVPNVALTIATKKATPTAVIKLSTKTPLRNLAQHNTTTPINNVLITHFI
jgi:hypothetical protein